MYKIENKADLCPVCRGTGKYKKITNYGSCTTEYERTCHGCDGKGWVVFPEISTSISGS